MLTAVKTEWVLAVTVIYLTVTFGIGVKRGLVRELFSIGSAVISLVLVRILYPRVQLVLTNSIWIQSLLEKWSTALVARLLQAASAGAINGSALPIGSNDGALQGGAENPANISLVPGRSGVDPLSLILKVTGIDQIPSILVNELVSIILGILILIITYVLVSLIVRMIFRVMNGIMSLPGLSGINRIFGGILALSKGLFYLWLFLIVVALLPDNPITRCIADAYETKPVLIFIRDHNLILLIIKKGLMNT